MNFPLSILQIESWAVGFILPFVRLSALFYAAPLFGAASVPVRVRLFLALLITVLITPHLPAIAEFDPLSGEGLLTIVRQVLIGIAMGFMFQLVFSALVIAGQTIAMSMGLGFATSFDPHNGVQVPVVSQFYVILGTLLFLVMDIHLFLIKVVTDSFLLMPIQNTPLPVGFGWQVALWASQMFVGSLLLALPVLTAILLINIGFGVITRASPQLNIFAVGFPVTLLAGFILMLFDLPSLLPILTGLYEGAFNSLFVLLQ